MKCKEQSATDHRNEKVKLAYHWTIEQMRKGEFAHNVLKRIATKKGKAFADAVKKEIFYEPY